MTKREVRPRHHPKHHQEDSRTSATKGTNRTRVIAAVLSALAVPAVTGLALLLPASPASNHGSMSDPPSRAYTCWQEGPESSDSKGCKAAVAAGGTQAFYDWHESRC